MKRLGMKYRYSYQEQWQPKNIHAEVTGSLTTASGNPIPDKVVQIAATGASAPAEVTTAADGSLAFDVTVSSAEATVSASRIAPASTVTMKIPTGWTGERPQNMVDVSTHAVSDSVTFAGNSPTLGTSATDQSDGDRSLAWDGGTIIDEVSYTGLIVGQEYTVTGELMDKATGEGTGITGETVFTAETADGVVSVEFVVPEGYAGQALVVFERLYDANGKLQAAHEDIDDEAQTVTVEEEPPVPGTPTSKDVLAKTGAEPILPFVLSGLLIAGLGASVLLYARRRSTTGTSTEA